MKRPIKFGIFIFFYSFHAMGEYRVYQYLIKSKFPQPQDQKPYIVTSTLHPQGYETYHGGSEALKIDLLRTWSCKGYTGNKKALCPSPTSKLQEQGTEEKIKK